MTAIKDKRGAWVNQYSQPTETVFKSRAQQVDYIIIKYGLANYERFSREINKPWVAEFMPERGPMFAIEDATKLAQQSMQEGCVAAVANLEEADGNWHSDDGAATSAFIRRYRQLSSKPLFASIDTRGDRPNYAYQRVLAAECAGVMPMVYPQAFQQPVPIALSACITPLVLTKWAGKELIPTVQTYGDISEQAVREEGMLSGVLYGGGKLHGINAYTLGHASLPQWNAFLYTTDWCKPPVIVPSPPQPVLSRREQWLEGWVAIAHKGTPDEALAYAQYWKNRP